MVVQACPPRSTQPVQPVATHASVQCVQFTLISLLQGTKGLCTTMPRLVCHHTADCGQGNCAEKCFQQPQVQPQDGTTKLIGVVAQPTCTLFTINWAKVYLRPRPVGLKTFSQLTHPGCSCQTWRVACWHHVSSA